MQNQSKVKKVMHEFKQGSLKSKSGKKVRSRKQAIAIGLSEAGLSRYNNRKSIRAHQRHARGMKKAS